MSKALIRNPTSPFYGKTAKRVLGVAASLLLLALLLPMLCIAGALVGITSGRPMLFQQQRPGRHGRSFILYKFRTMCSDTNTAGIPLPESSRVTGIGRLLRRASIDELPQLFNVLRRDMSLIGPRPLLPQHLALFTDYQRRRMEVRPGLTGWAQVNGRNALDFDLKCSLDVWYVDNFSAWLDVRILCLTVIRVAGMRDIDGQGRILSNATESPEPPVQNG